MEAWVAPTAIALATIFGAFICRSMIRRIGTIRHLAFIHLMAPSLSNLIYIVGLKLFSEAAPLPPLAQSWLERGGYVVGVLILLGLVRRAALLAIEWSVLRTNPSQTLQQGFIPLLRNLVTLFVFLAGSIMILKRFNYDVMSLLTALGVGSLAVGLAAKDTLSNMISGFTLIIDRNLRPGDRVNLGGSVGDVEEIGLRSTRIHTADGNTLIVPNSELVNTKILNLSHPSREAACSVVLRFPPAVDFERIRALCLSCCDGIEHLAPSRGRSVTISNLTDGMLQISVGFWVRDFAHQGSAISEFHEHLLKRAATQGVPLVATPAAPPLSPT